MLGLMQTYPLMISSLLTHAARHHGGSDEVVSRTHDGSIHRTTWGETERRARRLARVLQRLGIGAGDRVGTLAWNDYRHLEVYYAAPGMQAICHTINPRLHPDDITYIINHAADRVLFVDISFAALIGQIAPRIGDSVRDVVMLTGARQMPDVALRAGHAAALLRHADGGGRRGLRPGPASTRTPPARCATPPAPPGGRRACCTATARPVLHAYAVALPDVLGMRATDRILPVVPMFHVNAWGIPYATAMTRRGAGAAGAAPRRRQHGGPAERGACHDHLRRADRVARAACSTCAPAATSCIA